ncbi:MAG: PhoH family protein [candidate division WOR-3 bacterium]|nr:PhoH family protein [candidate division WOR-3 bacterium]MCX7947224.1 PhoH family protein [candidate division WOR-3 bacterium]MDW8150279.1 PhoH family protein [candidate division WOR-3 bacterium]
MKLEFSLKDVDIQKFVGYNDINLKSLKKLFPNLKIWTEDLSLVAEGDEEELLQLEMVMKSLVSNYHKLNKIEEWDVIETVQKIKRKLGKIETYEIVTPKKKVIPHTENQLKYLKAIDNNDIVFAIGPAGTGKTFLAIAMAVKYLNEERVERIILTRPAVEAGESLGYLPGTYEEKISPYLTPLYDALFALVPADKVQKLIDMKIVEIAPLAYMRGRTLSEAFIILDEAQNTTNVQMKMFLTRIGIRSKVVITGDITQIDLPKNKVSGLIVARNILKNIKGIEFIEFAKEDVVRHPLVKQIIEAYEKNS